MTISMDSIQTLADRLAIYLSAYKHYIQIKSKARLLNGAIFGEALSRDIAEIVFDYGDLVNLNLHEPNCPAIDLASERARHAIQVTIAGTSTKIESTLEMFFKQKLEAKYSKLRFVVLGNKQGKYDSTNIIRSKDSFSFNPETDIYDLSDLFNILVTQAIPEKFTKLNARLEQELGGQIRPFLQGYDRPGQNLRALFDAHDVTATNAVDALKPFGIDRKTYSETATLNDAVTNKLINFIAQEFGISSDWIDGQGDHIYANGPDFEKSTDWRRSLAGAFDLIKRVFTAGDYVMLVLPVEVTLTGLDGSSDVVNSPDPDYESFFLVSRDKNSFSSERYKLLLNDHFSYSRCREGISRLFLATELYEILTGRKKYLNILTTGRDTLASCREGSTFVVDIVRNGVVGQNQKDYVYYDGITGTFKTTKNMPTTHVSMLREDLFSFLRRRNESSMALSELLSPSVNLA